MGVLPRIGIRTGLAVGLATLFAIGLAAYDQYASIQQKFDLISSDRLRVGAHVDLSLPELNAYAARQAPPGVRNPKLQLLPHGEVTGTAMIDFGKLRRAQGADPGWLMSKLLDGERPVSVTVRITSAGGQARVQVEQVEISSIDIDGKVLDFLVEDVLLPLYPNAMVDKPFRLIHHIDRLDVQPGGVAVWIGR